MAAGARSGSVANARTPSANPIRGGEAEQCRRAGRVGHHVPHVARPSTADDAGAGPRIARASSVARSLTVCGSPEHTFTAAKPGQRCGEGEGVGRGDVADVDKVPPLRPSSITRGGSPRSSADRNTDATPE